MRVTTPQLFNTTITGINDIQQDLAKLQRQITTARKADTFQELGSDVIRVLELETSIATADRFIDTNKTVIKRLQTTDSAISAIQKIALDFKVALTRENSSSGPAQDLTGLAENALDNITDQLNKKDGSRFLFAGSKTDGAAVGDLKLFSNLINNVPTANYYRGDDVVFTTKASESLDVNYGIKANDDTFKNLIGAIHKAIEAEASGENDTLVTAGTLLDNAMEQLITMRSGIGINQQTMEGANKQHTIVKTQLEDFLGDVIDTDIVEASIRVAENQALLTASMQTFVRLSQLTLSDFLN